MKHRKVIQSIVFVLLVFFGVLVGVMNATDLKFDDAQKRNLKTGTRAVLRAQDNGDGTMTLLVVLATPGPTLTPTPTSTPSATKTPTATPTPSATP